MISNIGSELVDGNLVFQDSSKNELMTMDSVTRKVTAINLDAKIPFTAAANLAAGELVYISGWDATNSRPAMNKADADAANPAKCAEFVCDASVNQGELGYAVGRKLSAATLNTNSASAVGDPVYLDTTAGGWSLSAPSGAGKIVQRVGVVTVKSATVGQIMFYPFYSKTLTTVA